MIIPTGVCPICFPDSDKEMQEIYSKINLPSIIGTSGFKEWVYDKLLRDISAEKKSRLIKPSTPMKLIVEIHTSIHSYVHAYTHAYMHRCMI